MILLRYCGVPKMSYLLRVRAPDAILDTATHVDKETLLIARKLLGIDCYPAPQKIEITQQL